MNKYEKRHWNKTAGASPNAREVRGKHMRSRRYVAGDNWVECQRCGHDIYTSDAKLDGYTKGLVVCPKCYDAPHPQDYIRVPDDSAGTSTGMVTGVTTDSTIGLAGSTEIPASTLPCCDPPVIGTIADQSYEELDTITSIATGTTIFGTYQSVYAGQTWSPVSYSVDCLPTGLSIDGSTGAITGTLSAGTESESGKETVVTALYDSGERYSAAAFTWTITNNALEPDDASIVDNLCVWWDFSEDEYSYTTSEGATNVSHESDIAEVRNRKDVTSEVGVGTPTATISQHTGIWDAEVRNGLGAFLAQDIEAYSDLGTSMPADECRDQPSTIFCVAQVPAGAGTEVLSLWGPQSSTSGHRFFINNDAAGNVAMMQSVFNDEIFPAVNTETAVSDSWASRAGEWFCFYTVFNGTECDSRFNNEREATIFDDHDAGKGGATDITMGSVRVGTMPQHTGAAPGSIDRWGSYIGEFLWYKETMTDSQVDGVFTYLKNKWNLTDQYD